MADLNTTGTLSDLSARAVIATHPIYGAWAPIWIKLAHVREGAGGFLDGTYLIAHPREWEDHTADVPSKPTKKLKARRAIACYENFAATIIEAKKAALFREAPVRRAGSDDQQRDPTAIEQWWENVDGNGTSMDDFMRMAWDAAATFGHVVLYLEQPAAGADAQTAADAGQPYLCVYTPLDVLDWLEDERGNLQAVKFIEGVPRTDFNHVQAVPPRVRVVNATEWGLYDRSKGRRDGTLGEHNAHNMGRLPVATLYAQRRPLIQRIGHSVLHDPQLYIDLYNLLSELRELLRNQTFSLLNVVLGTGADAITIEQAQAALSGSVGTANVLFSAAPASYVTADAANVTAYQTEIERRLRLIYRLMAIQWEADSKQAEATGSLKLKREDMSQRLASYAGELEQTEYAIADLWYRATYGADIGPTRMKADGVVIQYPSTFDVTPFEVVIAQAQAALSLNMPAPVLKAIRKSLVGKFLPNLTPDQEMEMQQAIEDAPDDLTPDQRLTAKVNANLTGSTVSGTPKPGSKKEAA